VAWKKDFGWSQISEIYYQNMQMLQLKEDNIFYKKDNFAVIYMK
jgi:hypothetical protein